MIRLVAFALCCVFVSASQAQPLITVAKQDADIFIHEWTQDSATVSVTDRSGAAIKDLTPTEFTVWLDSANHRKVRAAELITLRSSRAIALSFVLDNSASIFSGYDSITKYLDLFIDSIPGKVLLSAYVFDDKDRSRMHEPTRRGDVFIAPSGDTEDRDSISRFMHFYDTVRAEFTPLYDQVGLALYNVRRRKDYGDTNRLNVVIVVSDGVDNASRTSIEDLLGVVNASDVRLFVLTYRSEPDRRLSWLANKARGASYTLQTTGGIKQALSEIRQELTLAYKIKYSIEPGGGKHLQPSTTPKSKLRLRNHRDAY